MMSKRRKKNCDDVWMADDTTTMSQEQEQEQEQARARTARTRRWNKGILLHAKRMKIYDSDNDDKY